MQQALFDILPPPAVPVQRWWRLHGDARRRGRAVEPLLVTPRFLARIDSTRCPVTREAIAPRSARVLSLRPDATVAAGHLVTVGPAAAHACAADPEGGWAAAWARAEALDDARTAAADPVTPASGLDAAAWRRLAVLRSFVQPLTPAQAAGLPLLVLPPRRLRVLSPVQSLQVAMTLALRGPDRASRLARVALAVHDEDLRLALRVFLLTLIARCPAELDARTGPAGGEALEDLWQDPLLQRRWQRLALRLTDAEALALLARARRQRLLGAGWRPLAAEDAVDGWDLAAPGRLESRDAVRPAAAAPLLAGPVLGPGAGGHGADAVAATAAGH
jgi:hypothetical protein